MKKIVIACLFGFGLISAGCNDAAKKPEPGATTAAAPRRCGQTRRRDQTGRREVIRTGLSNSKSWHGRSRPCHSFFLSRAICS